FDIENLDLEVVLYQAGYLTIESMEIDEDDDIFYTLKLPNKEVKSSFNQFIIHALYKDNTLKRKSIIKALREASLDDLNIAFRAIFASIPYNNYTNNNIQVYEGFYSSVVYVYLQSLGLDIIGEDVTSKGRIDLSVKIENYIYIIEFKVGGENALEQIKRVNYQEKYLNENKEIFLVGINFDEKERNISKFEYEKAT
ncbi:MAG: PD-(D/E)XK nuclease domain-containing protein, partial [Campylobacterota bacterium]|nr:PD-(D/E)XK nuclease domain-containing protein [Campylobacterota bacterium]